MAAWSHVSSQTEPGEAHHGRRRQSPGRSAEGIPEDATETMLINMSKNPVYQRRLEEIEAELWAMYGEEH